MFLQSLKKLKVFGCYGNPGMDGDPDLLKILAKFLPDGFEYVICLSWEDKTKEVKELKKSPELASFSPETLYPLALADCCEAQSSEKLLYSFSVGCSWII